MNVAVRWREDHHPHKCSICGGDMVSKLLDPRGAVRWVYACPKCDCISSEQIRRL